MMIQLIDERIIKWYLKLHDITVSCGFIGFLFNLFVFRDNKPG